MLEPVSEISRQNHQDAPHNGILVRFGEMRVLALILVVYVVVSLFVWGRFDTQYDEPGYTDPAASYVLGQGFTSGCWYSQSHDDFWVGNVPLHQCVLIALFKTFGFSKTAMHCLNLFYIVLTTILVWLGMYRTGIVPRAELRIGAVAFFLVSECSLCLALGGRPEPLCLLIASIAWVSLTLKNPMARWTVLGVCGVIAPWIGLQLAVYFAFFGIVALVFFWRSQWKNILAVACGGIVGSVAILLFYQHIGKLDDFLMSISPHCVAPSTHDGTSKPKQVIEGVRYIKPYALLGSRGKFECAGIMSTSMLFTILLSLMVCLSRYWNKLALRLIAIDWTIIIGLPLFFSSLGIFAYYYACFLMLPATVLLFAILSMKGSENMLGRRILSVLLCLSVAVPGAYIWRLAIQGVPSFFNDNGSRIEQFVKSVTRPDDVAWVDVELWYATKPLVKRTLSGLWGAQAKTGKDRDAISVILTVHGSMTYECLPGKWVATGESMEIPDLHRFYRFWEKASYRFEVFRRVSE